MKNVTNPTASTGLFPIWMMKSKVHPTRQRIDLLERNLLLNKLENCLDAAVSVIQAPAGYGKSTLMTSWRSRLLKANNKVCWLSLDREDNEVFQLLTYIAFSLAEAGVDFKSAELKDSSFFEDLSPRKFLSLINHAIETNETKVILILDDFENLDSDVVDNVIKPLLNYAPANLHIAIATRADQALKISNLEARGLVNRIDADYLRFTIDELDIIFSNYLSKAQIKKIYRITEGWPVTVQMIRNHVSHTQQLDILLDNFQLNTKGLTAYLSEQIIANLNSEQQDFLLEISILDRVSVSLANHLRCQDNSAAMFDIAKQLSTLVLPVEGVKLTYRLHPLFRDYLYSNLTTNHIEKARKLHLQAASWFTLKGNLIQAVSHCVKAGEPQLAVKKIQEAGAVSLWPKEGLTRLRAVIKLLDEQCVSTNPRITLIRCLIDIKDGNVFHARSVFNAALNNYTQIGNKLENKDKQRCEHEILLIESLLVLYEGRTLSSQMLNRLNDNIKTIRPDEHAILSHHFSALCVANAQRGLFTEARDYAAKALTACQSFNSVYGEIYLCFHLGDISFAEGKSEEAESHYQRSLKLTRQHFNDDKGMKLCAYVLTIELKYELNQVDSIPKMLETIPKQLEEREAWYDIYAAGYATTSNIEFAKFGLEPALAILDRAEKYATTQKLSRLLNLITFQRIDLLLKSNRVQQAEQLLEKSCISIRDYMDPDENQTSWREHNAAAKAVTSLLLAKKQFEEALESLDYFVQHAKKYGIKRAHIQYEILKALAYHGLAKHDMAAQHLYTAIELSKVTGFIRVFIDEGETLRELLHETLENYGESNRAHLLVEHATNILSAFGGKTENDTVNEQLSKREKEVLQQLAHGFSNKVIARTIDISENTVRFHLKNIFSKLNVDNRVQAVSVAQKKNVI